MTLAPDEEAYTESLNYNGTLWDAVFVSSDRGGRELKALTASPEMAEFIAQALNETRASGQIKTGVYKEPLVANV